MSNDLDKQNQNVIDDNLLELLENRIGKKVSENVERGLRWRYGLVAAAVVGIIGFFGWSIKSSIDAQIGLIASSAKTKFDTEISNLKTELDKDTLDLKREAEDTINDAKISIGITAEHQRRTNILMDEIEKTLNEFQRKLPVIEQMTEKFAELDDQRKTIQVQLEDANYKVAALQGTAEKLADLANQVNALSKLIVEKNPKASEIATEVQKIETASRKSVKAVEKTDQRIIVFIQFADTSRQKIETVSTFLNRRGYTIPGEERVKMASNTQEVRYFHEADRKAALDLSRDTKSVLSEIGYRNIDVKATSLTSWTGQKPRPGVLELWLSLPEQEEIEIQSEVDTNKISAMKKVGNVIKISELVCLDPQSNYPKECDEVYLKANGKKLWNQSRRICRGEQLKIDIEVPFDDQTRIELWESDDLSDDLLGSFKVMDKLTNSEDKATFSHSSVLNNWNYIIRFNQINK
jgi:uncharacterized protein YoxC